jgi:hypothetical protein
VVAIQRERVAVVIGLFLAAIVIAVREPVANDDAAVGLVIGELRSQLRDPDATQLRFVRSRRSGDTTYVCGEFNSKNAFGAYVGFEPFGSINTAVSTWTQARRIGPAFWRDLNSVCAATPMPN